MYIYNVTIKVSDSIKSDWLIWLKEEHIPDVMRTSCFESSNVLRLREVDDTEGPTYIVQYTCKNKENYDRYINHFATDMRNRSYEKWGNGFIAFRTLLEQMP